VVNDETREAVAEELYDLFTENVVAEWDDIDEESDPPRRFWMDAADQVLASVLAAIQGEAEHG